MPNDFVKFLKSLEKMSPNRALSSLKGKSTVLKRRKKTSEAQLNKLAAVRLLILKKKKKMKKRRRFLF